MDRSRGCQTCNIDCVNKRKNPLLEGVFLGHLNHGSELNVNEWFLEARVEGAWEVAPD